MIRKTRSDSTMKHLLTTLFPITLPALLCLPYHSHAFTTNGASSASIAFPKCRPGSEVNKLKRIPTSGKHCRLHRLSSLFITRASKDDIIDTSDPSSLLKGFLPLKNLEEDDRRRLSDAMVPVTVSQGDEIITQGDAVDEQSTMFFLEHGSFKCFDKKSGNLLKTYTERGDYFGELALLFSQPRAASIVANEKSVVWALKQEDFLNAVKESPIYNIATAIILQKYRVQSMSKLLKKITFEEFMDLLRTKSRPRRKAVSQHAELATYAMASFFTIYASLWNPGTDVFGYPRFFDVDVCPNMLPIRISGFLFTIVSVMGMFRIPKKAPVVRYHAFSFLAWNTACLNAVIDSNLGGLTKGYTLDAWSFPGRMVIGSLLVGCTYKGLVTLYDAIAGPMKGKETVPMQTPRISAAISTFFASLMNLPSILLSMHMLGSREQNEALVAPFFRNGYSGFLPIGLLSGQAYIGFTGFIMTLMLEKKMSTLTAALAFLPLTALCFYDTLRLGVGVG